MKPAYEAWRIWPIKAIFRELYGHRWVLEVVEAVIGPDLRAAMVNARDALPHTRARMPFHMDSDKGRTRDARGYSAATAIWMLDGFTLANGATAFVPCSHLLGKSPKEVLPDMNASHPDEIIIEGRPGDVLVFNGHCWHAGRPKPTVTAAPSWSTTCAPTCRVPRTAASIWTLRTRSRSQ